MKSKNDESLKKISSVFLNRRDSLALNQNIRAIVLIRSSETHKSSRRRQNYSDRHTAIDIMQKSVQKALRDVDHILKSFDGKRLVDSPNALGFIPVETSAAGIRALAGSKWVKAIMEDQQIVPNL
jgi:hypothetical protein